MTASLHSTLKRAINIGGREYVLTLTMDGLKLTLKGKHKGIELAWTDLVSGDAALATALHASIGAIPPRRTDAARQPAAKPRAHRRPAS